MWSFRGGGTTGRDSGFGTRYWEGGKKVVLLVYIHIHADTRHTCALCTHIVSVPVQMLAATPTMWRRLWSRGEGPRQGGGGERGEGVGWCFAGQGAVYTHTYIYIYIYLFSSFLK